MEQFVPPHVNPPKSLTIDGEEWLIVSWDWAKIVTPVATGFLKNGAQVTLSREGHPNQTRFVCTFLPDTCVASYPKATSLRPHIATHTRDAKTQSEKSPSVLTEDQRKANTRVTEAHHNVRNYRPESTPKPSPAPFTPTPTATRKDLHLEVIVSRMGELERDIGWLVGELTTASDAIAQLRNDIEKAAENAGTSEEVRRLRETAAKFDAMKALMSSGSEDDD